MAFSLVDWSWETTTTNGTGAYALLGGVAPFRPFSAQMSDGDTTYLSVFDGTNYEEGLYTYNASPNTFTRTAIYRSTNGNAAVNWTGGTTKQIMGAQLGITLQSLLTPGSTGVPERTADNTWEYLGLSGSGSTLALTQSPTLTGAPTAPTQAAGDSSTKIATTAFAASTFLQQFRQTATSAAAATFTGTYSTSGGTAPTSTSGVAITPLATSFTPKSNASVLRISLKLFGCAVSASDIYTFSIFNGGALVDFFTIQINNGVSFCGSYFWETYLASPGTSALSFTVRVGATSGNGFALNSANNGGIITMNGATSFLNIDEIAPHA